MWKTLKQKPLILEESLSDKKKNHTPAKIENIISKYY